MSERSDLPGAVLFACSRSAVRSPMAAALLKHLAGNRIYVESAGVRPGEPNPFAIAAQAASAQMGRRLVAPIKDSGKPPLC